MEELAKFACTFFGLVFVAYIIIQMIDNHIEKQNKDKEEKQKQMPYE